MGRLWYRQPANVWEEALPLGNGRMGAMVFGGVEKERIQVNEESIWYGGETDRLNPDAYGSLEEIRVHQGQEICPEPADLREFKPSEDLDYEAEYNG